MPPTSVQAIRHRTQPRNWSKYPKVFFSIKQIFFNAFDFSHTVISISIVCSLDKAHLFHVWHIYISKPALCHQTMVYLAQMPWRKCHRCFKSKKNSLQQIDVGLVKHHYSFNCFASCWKITYSTRTCRKNISQVQLCFKCIVYFCPEKPQCSKNVQKTNSPKNSLLKCNHSRTNMQCHFFIEAI